MGKSGWIGAAALLLAGAAQAQVYDVAVTLERDGQAVETPSMRIRANAPTTLEVPGIFRMELILIEPQGCDTPTVDQVECLAGAGKRDVRAYVEMPDAAGVMRAVASPQVFVTLGTPTEVIAGSGRGDGLRISYLITSAD